MTNSPFNAYSPVPSCCLSECNGICDPRAEHYTITFSEMPWGLPVEWVLHKENWYDGTVLDPIACAEPAIHCCTNGSEIAIGTETCYHYYWRKVYVGEDDDIQCGTITFVSTGQPHGAVGLSIDADSDGPFPANLRARIEFGCCIESDGLHTIEYWPDVSEWPTEYEHVTPDLLLGGVGGYTDCDDLPGTSDNEFWNDAWYDGLSSSWVDAWDDCHPLLSGWLEGTTFFAMFATWTTPIVQCSNINISGIAMTLPAYWNHSGTWCDIDGYPYQMDEDTTVSLVSSA